MAFLSQALQHGQNFAASYKPNTAVTDWIERLCSSSYKITDYEGIPELVESINLQYSGPGEAARMLRKKLKYGNTHMQLRAIFVLKCLVENCGERTNFAKNFPDPTLVERLKIIAADPQTDPSVKKTLMATLKGFHASYQSDRSMRVYAEWWDAVGGARGEQDARAKEAYKKEQERLDQESQLRLDEKMAARLQAEEDESAKKRREEIAARKAEKARREAATEQLNKAREEEEARRAEKEKAKAEKKSAGGFLSSVTSGGASSGTTASKGKRVPFNFEQEKPRIQQAVATASMYSNGLVNALQHVNREKESVSSNVAVQNQLNKLKESRKQVIRYVQLCEVDKEGEYIGMLISSNDQIIAALRLYDRMLTKPADEDSDDDNDNSAALQQALAASKTEAPAQAPAAAAPAVASPERSVSPPKADSIHSNLQKMHLNNSSKRSLGELDKLRDRQRTEIYRENRRRGNTRDLETPGIYGDLAGINFGSSGNRDGGSSGLQAPMAPKHAVESHDRYGQGNLSDYSDYYSSSDDEDYRSPTSSSGNRAWKDFVRDDDRRGGGSRNLLGDPDDPFGDTAEYSSKPRAHVWAEI